jgi:hypothetical protein
MIAVELPNKDELIFLSSFGATAISLATVPIRRSLVACGLCHRTITDIWWTHSRGEAEAMIERAGPDLDAETARDVILAAARRLGIRLTDNATALARCRAAIAHLDQQLAEAQQRGALKFFNQAYREYRVTRPAGGRFLTYQAALGELRRQIVPSGGWRGQLDLGPGLVERVLAA